MKEIKEYKGIYFSNKPLKNNDSKLNIKKHKNEFFENGAHFKYSSLYKELQKLYKIQNYSPPKKKIKKKRQSLNSENINKYNKIFLFKIEQIKNKNKHNIKEKTFDIKKINTIHNTTFNKNKRNNSSIKKYINSKNIISNNKNNPIFSSFVNSEKKLLTNKTCENTIKNIKKNNKSKIYHIISKIRKKLVDNKQNKDLYNYQKIKNKYSSSFVNKIYPSTGYKKHDNLEFNLKTNNINSNKLNVSNNNKDIIKVNIKVLTHLNKKNKK